MDRGFAVVAKKSLSYPRPSRFPPGQLLRISSFALTHFEFPDVRAGRSEPRFFFCFVRLVRLVRAPGRPSNIGCRDRLAASSLPDARPVSRHHSRASLSGLPGLAVAFLCPSADSLRALRAADLRVTTTAQSRRPWRPGRCPPSAPLFRIVWPFWVLRTHVNVRIGLSVSTRWATVA